MTAPDPESISWLRIVIAFSVVFGLLALFGYGLKQVSLRGLTFPGRMPRQSRLQMVETLAIDIRRRLVIVRCDGKEHLLLLGANQDIVVESNLAAAPPQTVPSTEMNA
jgi:flagellar protein FliO/FliZ